MEMPIKKSENIIQDTKQYIVNTARQLFSEYSYLGVSMSDIASKLKITKAALYYHFTGKAELYKKVLDDVFDDLSLNIAQSFEEKAIDKKLHKLIKNYLDFGCKENNLIKALILKLSPSDNKIVEHVIELRGQIIALIHPVIKEISLHKKLTQKVDSLVLTSMLTSMMDGLLLEYSFLNKKINSAKISDQIIAVLF